VYAPSTNIDKMGIYKDTGTCKRLSVSRRRKKLLGKISLSKRKGNHRRFLVFCALVRSGLLYFQVKLTPQISSLTLIIPSCARPHVQNSLGGRQDRGCWPCWKTLPRIDPLPECSSTKDKGHVPNRRVRSLYK